MTRLLKIEIDPKRSNALWFFGSRYWRELGIGGLGLGYVRVTVPRKAKHPYRYGALESLRPRRYMDNEYGPFWMGFVWQPFGRKAFAFRWYRFVATHLTVGPFVFSYVRDREKTGPIGPVYGWRVR